MTEVEALTEIVDMLSSIRAFLALINIALWCMLLCKRNYSDTDGIENAIKNLTDLIRSRR